MKSTGRFANPFVGSKGGEGLFQKIINQIGPHRVLIEPFAGEATIARKIRPPAEIILIDKIRQPGLVLTGAAAERATFILGDGIAYLDGYRFKGDEFVYIDPPYLLESLSARGVAYYQHILSRPDHGRLLRVAKSINVRVMISGYHSPLYDDELSDWRLIEFEVMTRGGTKATECLWMNYPPPVTLHDYRFLGDDFRERERLGRKIRRAVADLVSMPPLERAAMFAAMAAAMPGRTAGTSDKRKRPRPPSPKTANARQSSPEIASLQGKEKCARPGQPDRAGVTENL